jgi:uncharacterized protein (DUF2141 family)
MLMKYSLMALALCAAGMSAQAADLTVSFAGMSAAKGQVMVALYASEEAWGKQEAVQVARLPAEGSLDTVFKNLPAGRYAIAAYLDGNLNGKLDRNGVGMPLEPYGFSRNASARYGRPGFADVAVVLGKDDTKISIDLE